MINITSTTVYYGCSTRCINCDINYTNLGGTDDDVNVPVSLLNYHCTPLYSYTTRTDKKEKQAIYRCFVKRVSMFKRVRFNLPLRIWPGQSYNNRVINFRGDIVVMGIDKLQRLGYTSLVEYTCVVDIYYYTCTAVCVPVHNIICRHTKRQTLGNAEN